MRKLQMDELNRMNTEEFKSVDKSPIVIVLDGIRSLHNVGSIFRTSDAFRVEKIILCGITGTPPHREIEKTALGATKTVDWEYVENAHVAVKELQMSGYLAYALEQTDGSVWLQDTSFRTEEKYCFVFGNEVFGVSDEVINICDASIEIPQFGTKHSFNVSVSIGIVLWDYYLKTRS
jgi:23S rRNA (guanosine2251-2'-O)-methyltransferase